MHDWYDRVSQLFYYFQHHSYSIAISFSHQLVLYVLMDKEAVTPLVVIRLTHMSWMGMRESLLWC